jgi:hypothetical protein
MLHTPPIPEAAQSAVEAGLGQLVARPGYDDVRMLARADVSALSLSVPHDVYTVGLDDLARPDGLAAAQRVGRRFLVLEGDNAVASAELGDPDAGTGFIATEGPFVEETAAAVASAEQMPEVVAGDYELRLLRIPSAYLMALWLKDRLGETDLLIPLAPTPPGLEPRVRYSPAELFELLRGSAVRRSDIDDGEDLQP